MTFWEHFLRVAWRRPVPAFAALYWHLTRRRVRARNRLSVSSADLPFAYRLWIAKNENFDGGAEAVHSEIEEWSWHPRFSVVVHSSQTEQQVSRSIASVKSQTYPIWTCSQLPIDSAIASDCDFVIPLRAGSGRLSRRGCHVIAGGAECCSTAAKSVGLQRISAARASDWNLEDGSPQFRGNLGAMVFARSGVNPPQGPARVLPGAGVAAQGSSTCARLGNAVSGES